MYIASPSELLASIHNGRYPKWIDIYDAPTQRKARKWIHAVDRCIGSRNGLTIADYDYCYADAFADGLTPEETANDVLQSS